MHYLPDAALFVLFLAGLAVAQGAAWPRLARAERIPWVACCWLGGLALLITLAGAVRANSAVLGVLAAGWLGAALVVGLRQREHTRAELRATLAGARGWPGLERWLVFYCLFIFAVTFILCLTPTGPNDYDSLTYHLATPRQYLRAGHIIELPYDHHSYFPFTMEMLYLLGLAWHGTVLARLFHWLMLPLSCLTLAAIGQRHLSRCAGLLAATLFASLPVVQVEASTTYVDLGLVAFSLLAFMCLANWQAQREHWWLVWGGMFCGFCLGLKYLGVLTLGWLGMWALGQMAVARKIEAKPLLRFAALAVLIGGGWYLRNWLWTSNPVYPFAYSIFGGKNWSAAMAAAYEADQKSFGFGRAPLDWLWLPWRVAMAPLNAGRPFWPFSDALVGPSAMGLFDTPGSALQSIVGPALLAFGAPLLFVRRKPAVVGFALWSFAFFAVFWAATGQYIRYLLPPFALLCLACGWSIERYLGRSAVLKWTVAIVLAAWLAFTPALTLWRARDSFAVLSGRETPEAYLTRTFPAYEAMRWASTQTPATARFAVYGEPRCFYLERDYFWADAIHSRLIDYDAIHSGAALVQALKKQGATHVLWNTDPARTGGAGGPPQPWLDQAIETGLLRALFEARGYRIFEISETPS